MYGYDFSPDFGPTRNPFLFLGNPVKHCQIGRKTRRVDDWDYLPLNLASKNRNEYCEARTHMCSTYSLPLHLWMGKICLARSCCKYSAKSEQPRKSPGAGPSFSTLAPAASSKSRVSFFMFWDAKKGAIKISESQSNFDSLHPFFSPVVRHAVFNKHQDFLMHDPGFLHHQVTRLSHRGRRQHALR